MIPTKENFETQEREPFENYARAAGLDLQTRGLFGAPDEYMSGNTEAAWKAWLFRASIAYLDETLAICDGAEQKLGALVASFVTDEAIDDLEEVADWLFDQISGHTEYIGRDAGLGMRGRAVQLIVKGLRSAKDLSLANKATGG